MKPSRLLAAALVAALPFAAHAESTFVSGPGSASARLDFRITVPRVLFLQVGTGTAFANNTTIDLIDFAPTAAQVAAGGPVAATAGSGDQGNGAVSARVFGNNGAITLTSTTLGALSNGAGDTISYGQINTAVTALAAVGGTPLPHPTLVDGGTGTQTIAPASGKVVNRGATWTYSYANSSAAAPGTYGGVNVNNGRVTYTAAMP